MVFPVNFGDVHHQIPQPSTPDIFLMYVEQVQASRARAVRGVGEPPGEQGLRAPELPAPGLRSRASHTHTLIIHKLFIKSFYKSQFPHKSVNLSLLFTNMKNKLTDLCGNRLLQNDFINTLCETNSPADVLIQQGLRAPELPAPRFRSCTFTLLFHTTC